MLTSLAALLVLAACARDVDTDEAADPYLELRERLGIGADRPIHRVVLGGRGAREHVVPTQLTVRPGAVVDFVTVDGRVHTLSFADDSLSAEARDFLRRTGQTGSPPLLDRGARFVLDLDGAPEGRYPFRSEGPGGDARGVIVVTGER